MAESCEPTWNVCVRPTYIGAVPSKDDSSDPETFLEYLEEDRVIDGVKGAALVEQDPDTGMPATVNVAHYSIVDVDLGGFGRMACAVRGLMRWQQIVRFHMFIEAYRRHSFDGLRQRLPCDEK